MKHHKVKDYLNMNVVDFCIERDIPRPIERHMMKRPHLTVREFYAKSFRIKNFGDKTREELLKYV